MKKVFAIVLSLLFLATISMAVTGCNKGEEQKPPAPPKVQAPAPAPAPAATPAPTPAPVAKPATAPDKAKAPGAPAAPEHPGMVEGADP